jgi:hypothetical protein
MNVAFTVLLGVVAVVASGLAVAAGTNEGLAVPTASIAVVAAALLLVQVVTNTRWPPGRPLPTLSADPGRVRSSLRAGTRGRPALVLLLDSLERAEGNPNRPNTTLEEIARLGTLSPEEFRKYLTQRVSSLEGER